ncbi:Uncharacterised protein [Mycobacteroides abscessus]|nr:Uncharacterised protein [Mycobacteroides abscessus]
MTSLAWAMRSAEKWSRPDSTATTVSPSGASSSRRSAARADALPGGAGSTSEVLSKTAPPSTAPATRRTAQTTRTTPRRRAANRPVRCRRRPSVMGAPLVGNSSGSRGVGLGRLGHDVRAVRPCGGART